MSVLRKLRRKAHRSEYPAVPLGAGDFIPFRKMSEVILDFAQPLLGPMDNGYDEHEIETLVFAALCWNLSFMSAEEQREGIEQIVNETCRSDVACRIGLGESANMLIRRKKSCFADDGRIVLDCKFIGGGDSQQFIVLSALTKD
ncbi:MAG: hypothetical protein JSU94_19335 [Phycisphaerales bacterium]|nr:MAG: hypothetical protein JSU94_19335 [Phycisphaerales bacterium]